LKVSEDPSEIFFVFSASREGGAVRRGRVLGVCWSFMLVVSLDVAMANARKSQLQVSNS